MSCRISGSDKATSGRLQGHILGVENYMHIVEYHLWASLLGQSDITAECILVAHSFWHVVSFRNSSLIPMVTESAILTCSEGTITCVYELPYFRVKWDNIRGIFRCNIRGMFGGNIRGMFGGNIRRIFGGNIRGILWGNIRGRFRGTVREIFRCNIRGIFRGNIRGIFRGNIKGIYIYSVDQLVSGLLTFISRAQDGWTSLCWVECWTVT